MLPKRFLMLSAPKACGAGGLFLETRLEQSLFLGPEISAARPGMFNYDPDLHPEKWEKFVDFTHNQIMELLTDYGKIDIYVGSMAAGFVNNRTKR